MSDDSLWSRVRKARLVQILAVYLGVSWVILQVVGELRDALELPAWIGPVSLILLVIGLFIILATAWVQSHPLVRRREAADEVPGSWELALGEIRDSIVRGEIPHLTWGRALVGGMFAFSLLFGFAGLYVVVSDRGRSFTPAPALAEDAAPGIAVLPFAVTDPELEEWREGMVNLLSTNLDGAGGLRAIDSRTVLARWDELAPSQARPDLETALRAARATGARHALLGSAVSAGEGLRLTAEVHDLESGATLGPVQVEGPANSIFSLVDRLSIAVLGVILPDVEGAFSGVSLARLTTSSLPALRAYLEGEALFRRAEFDAAIPAYERAVEADSSFALAHYRLSHAYGWAENIQSELSAEAIERAARFAHRLPDREALLVRAERALLQGTLDGIELLRTAVRRYPEDVEAWYLLGDTYVHLGAHVPLPESEAEEAFRRAVELDPGFSPAYIHLMDAAFRVSPDSARGRALIDRYAAVAPGSESHRTFALAFDLAFGDSAAFARAASALDTASVNLASMAMTDLVHARFLDGFERVAGVLQGRSHPFAASFRFLSGFLQGRYAEATGILADPATPALARWLQLPLLSSHVPAVPDGPEPPGWADQDLETAVSDTASVPVVFAGGLYAWQRGRGREREAAVRQLRGSAERLLTQGDTAGSRFAQGAAKALEGLAARREGDPERAWRLLEEARAEATGNGYPGHVLNGLIRLELARLAVERGRPAQAEPYYRSLWWFPVAQLELGRLHEALGEREKAREAYVYFVTAWRDPDPAFEPLVEEIRQRVAALMDAPAD